MDDNSTVIQFPGTQRIGFDLFISHPILSADAISACLGLEPDFWHSVNEPRQKLTGQRLSGRHTDTRWRYARRQILPSQHFTSYFVQFVDSLAPHSSYFAELAATGGSATIIISFLGDGHYGDSLERGILAKLVALNLDLGIESYSTRQR